MTNWWLAIQRGVWLGAAFGALMQLTHSHGWNGSFACATVVYGIDCAASLRGVR